MHNKTRLITYATIAILLSAVVFVPVFGDDKKKKSSFDILQDQITDISSRVQALETNTHVTVASSSAPHTLMLATINTNPNFNPITVGYPVAPVLPQSCADRGVIVTNFGTVDTPLYLYNGWCPEAHDYLYFIPDMRVTDTSIVLVQLGPIDIGDPQYAGLSPPTATKLNGGTYPDVNGTSYTGFVIETLGNNPVANETMSWLVLN